MFRTGHEPDGKFKVNTYYHMKYINVVLNVLEDDQYNKLMESQFGHLLTVGNSIASSSQLFHYILSRQLITKKLHEIWCVFSGQPFRFSLREYAIATGLNCSPVPQESEVTPAAVASDIEMLFGSEKNATHQWIERTLKGRPYKTKEIRTRLALLLLTDGVICASSHVARVSPHHILLSRNVDEFLSYPWGRKSFDQLITSIKKVEIGSYINPTFALSGFVHALQVVTIGCVPSILSRERTTNPVLNPVADEEADEMSEEDEDIPPRMPATREKPVNVTMSRVRSLD